MIFRKAIRNLVHKLLLPRGRQYTTEVHLEKGWTKYTIEKNKKKLCILQNKAEGTTKGIIVLAHPYLADAKKYFLKNGHAKMYIENGYDTVIFDFNGFGESPFINFSYDEDLKMVAEHIKKTNPDLPVFGHGISFGASHTITYASCQNNVFNKIIIENCLDSNLSYYRKRNKNLHFLMLGLMKIFPNVNKNHNYINTIKHLKKISNVLFIYNSEDDLTTIAMGEQLHQNCSIPCSLEIFSGKHLGAFQNNKKRYAEVISSFLDDFKIKR